MFQKFSTAQLKSGEPMEIGVAIAPEPPLKDKIVALLQHKGGVWNWHVERSMRERLDGLETRYHIGSIAGEPVSNVMTLEYKGIGILGHVFTKPEHRRKGACHAIMRELMEDFRRRGGRLLHLGTGFESPPYWIYHSFGFRSLAQGSGHMRYGAEADPEARLFAPSACRIADVFWHHWPMLTTLTSTQQGDYLRNMSYQHFGFANFESGFLDLKKSLETDPGRYRCKVLETETGATAGYAMVRPFAQWRGMVNVVEVFVHPGFAAKSAELLAALPLPPGKAQCYADADSQQKIAALRQCGFDHEATLAQQITRADRRLDVLVFSKRVP